MMGTTIAYQIQYEICALIFLIALVVHFFFSKRFYQPTNWIFVVVIIAALADILLDILGCLTVAHINDIPPSATYIVNALFYCLQIFLPAMMATYFIFAAGESYKSSIWYRILLAPAALFMLIQFINPFTGWIFSVQQINGSYAFVFGNLHMAFYACTGFYILATLGLIISLRKKLTRKQCEMGSLFIVVVLVAVGVQFIFPELLLTGTAITVSIMLMMFTIQNPDDMLDGVSGAFNFNALSAFLGTAIEKKHALNLIAIEIDGAESVSRGSDLTAEKKTFSDIGRFLISLSKSNWVFRLSNNKFLISVKEEKDMSEMAMNISRRFEKPWVSEGEGIELISTIIYFSTPQSTYSQTELTSFIDESINSESVEYGKCVHVEVGETFIASISRRKAIESSLRRALSADEGLELYYQPLCNAEDRSFASAEALLRFNDKWLGFVSPGEFIPIAEKCGLAPKIDSFVLNQACKFLKTHPSLKMLEINLSGADFFTNPAARFSQIVEFNEVDPSRICFEITETAAASHPEILREFVSQMKEKGFTFALDDFGTGYANLNQLTDMPFSIIKLDRSLIQEGEKKQELVRSLLSMFNSMGFKSVAEGVETEEQYERLRKQGAQLIQGYLYSKPLPGIAFNEFLNRIAL